jgi:HEXXH motif-containing protein
MSFRIDGLAPSVSATPDLSRARELRRGMDIRLLNSLLAITTRVSERTNIDCGLAIDNLSASRSLIEKSEKDKLSYAAYSLHWTIKKAITAKEHERLPYIIDQFERSLVAERHIRIFPLRLESREPCEEILIDTLASEHKETYKFDLQFSEPLPDEIQATKQAIDTVLARIAGHDPATYAEIASLVTDIALIKEPHLNAGSSFPMYGCIYVHVAHPNHSWVRFLEHLTHETAHHWLFGIWTLDPILREESGDGYKSPLRTEPRPMSAIFHQMFVLARVIRIWSVFQSIGQYGPEMYRAYTNYQNDQDGANFTEKFWLAAKVIEKHGQLTAVGTDLFNECRALVEQSPVHYDA